MGRNWGLTRKCEFRFPRQIQQLILLYRLSGLCVHATRANALRGPAHNGASRLSPVAGLCNSTSVTCLHSLKPPTSLNPPDVGGGALAKSLSIRVFTGFNLQNGGKT